MRFKTCFLIVSTLLISGCVEVDSFSIEVKEDLSSTINFIVSPPDTKLTGGNQGIGSFSEDVNSTFKKCGFKTQPNTKYNLEGISANQAYSSIFELEQSINCLINTSDQYATVPHIAFPSLLRYSSSSE